MIASVTSTIKQNRYHITMWVNGKPSKGMITANRITAIVTEDRWQESVNLINSTYAKTVCNNSNQ